MMTRKAALAVAIAAAAVGVLAPAFIVACAEDSTDPAPTTTTTIPGQSEGAAYDDERWDGWTVDIEGRRYDCIAISPPKRRFDMECFPLPAEGGQ